MPAQRYTAFKISLTLKFDAPGIPAAFWSISAAKLNKTVDIAMASREMKDAEWDKAKSAGLDLQEVTIAYDGITIIVNKSNPVKNLTTEQ